MRRAKTSWPRARVLLGARRPGQLVVASAGRNRSERTGNLLEDLARGTFAPAESSSPWGFPGWGAGDPTQVPEPGSEATKLFYGPNGSLVRFDPLTGKRRVILAGRS